MEIEGTTHQVSVCVCGGAVRAVVAVPAAFTVINRRSEAFRPLRLWCGHEPNQNQASGPPPPPTLSAQAPALGLGLVQVIQDRLVNPARPILDYLCQEVAMSSNQTASLRSGCKHTTVWGGGVGPLHWFCLIPGVRAEETTRG